MRRATQLILFLLTCLTGKLYSQPQCTVTHFNESNGIMQWYVTQIVQDRQGMMWFSTWNGLNRYDGYDIQCFKSKPGDGVNIPSDRIQDMMLTEDGNLLCQIDERAFLFDVNSYQYKEIPNKQQKTALMHLKSRIKKHNDDFYIYQDRFGTTWSIHRNGSVSYLQNNKWVPYSSAIEDNLFLLFGCTDREGNVWMRTGNSVYKFSFNQQRYTLLSQKRPFHARSFFFDSHQRFWVGSRDDASIRIYDNNYHLLGYLSHDGQIHKEYVSFGSPVYHIMQDRDGVFWLSSKPNGLFRLTEKADGTFSVEQFLHNPTNKHSLNNNNVYYSVQDQLGRLWIATFDGGINCILSPQDKNPKFYHHDNGINTPDKVALRVRQIHISTQGILMAATTSGLLIANVNKKNVKDIRFQLHRRNPERASSIANNAVMYVLEDSQHRVFICTESGGVDQVVSDNLLDDQLSFRHYNISGNLPSDIALSAFDNHGTLMVISNGQMYRLEPDEGRTTVYNAYYWKKDFSFSEASPLQLPDGHTAIGLQDGVLMISEPNLNKSHDVPPIYLTSIFIHGKERLWAVNHLDTLILHSPSDRDVTINFATLAYASNSAINYAYQMDKQTSWQNIGQDHSATFLNLTPGTYQLKIRSTNSDGLWVDNDRILTIIVEPTFWETNWAKALYILLIGIIIWSIGYTIQYIRHIKQQQRETHEAYLALLNEKHSIGQPLAKEKVIHVKPKMKIEDELFMKRAMKFIEEHMDDLDVSTSAMAQELAISRSGLNRKMKSILGVTPLDFIREARIQKACMMLKEGAMVKDVAYACGFSDVIYFRKCFKAEIGMAPSEYRDKIMSANV